MWHDCEESDPKQQEKAAGFGEKQRPNHISGTRYCVHKKDPRRSFCKAPSCKSPEARVSPLQTISERTWLFPRQASGTLVPSANWSLGRPGGSANLPTKIQAVPAAAPPLSLLAALGFICGDNPPPPPPALGSPALFITTAIPYHLPEATSRNPLTTRYKPETIHLAINRPRISEITIENIQRRRTQRPRCYRQNEAGTHWLNWRERASGHGSWTPWRRRPGNA